MARILVVEDNPAFMAAARRRLEQSKASPEFWKRAFEALERRMRK